MISLPKDPDSPLTQFAVSFADDDAQAPRLDEHDAMVSVGREWLRVHLPEVWAGVVGARILGRTLEASWDEWERCCKVVQGEAGFGVKNEVLAIALVKRMYEFIKLDRGLGREHPAERVLS